MKCSIDGCRRPRRALGYCASHYKRWVKTGETPPAVVAPKMVDGVKMCSVDGCDRPYKCSGYCGFHYRRVREHGDPLADKPYYYSQGTPEELFLRRVLIAGEDDCWWWTGGLDKNGYGVFMESTPDGPRRQRSWRAHQFGWWVMWRSPVADGLVLDHLCRNPSCVNPKHLEPVTQGVNVHRSPISQASINAAKTHCPAGHPYNEENTLVNDRGWRTCRPCHRAHQNRRRARARQEAT